MESSAGRSQWTIVAVLILVAAFLTGAIGAAGLPAWAADAAKFVVQTVVLTLVVGAIVRWFDRRREFRVRRHALSNLLSVTWLAATAWSSPSEALGEVKLDRELVRKELDVAIAELDKVATSLNRAEAWARRDVGVGDLDECWPDVTVVHFNIMRMNPEGGRNRRHALLNRLADREVARLSSVDSDVHLRELALELELSLIDLFASRQHADSVIGERALFDLIGIKSTDAFAAAIVSTNPLLLAEKLFEHIEQQPIEGPNEAFQLAGRCLGALRNEAVKTQRVLKCAGDLIDELAVAIDRLFPRSVPALGPSH
jgi:hypothetical protein